MFHGDTAHGAVMEKLLEFDRVAGMLDMPESERLGILNISPEDYADLRHGGPDTYQAVKPELERRLSYALPMMRRLANGNRMAYALPGRPASANRSGAAPNR